MLVCVLCGRRQAEGLLSRGAWGHVTTASGRRASACPGCKGQYDDWEERIRVSVADDTDHGPRFGSVYR